MATRSLRLTVHSVGEPRAVPLLLDLSNTEPSTVASLAAAALGLSDDAVALVELLTEDGWEKTDPADFENVAALEAFLKDNEGDCLLEVRLADAAVVSLWDGSGEDGYPVGKAELRHLSCDFAALLQRFQELLPLVARPAFFRGLVCSVDDGPPQPLEAAGFSQVREDAADGRDVVLAACVVIPEEPQPPLLTPPARPSGLALGECSHYSQLSPADLRDRVQGVLWGAALADAVGLSTEFMSKAEAAAAYPDPSRLGPAHRMADEHRKRWCQGDWTDDTDQLLLLLEAVLEGNGLLDHHHFARSLKSWLEEGFPELSDTGGLGVGATVSAVLEHPAFLVAPDVAADAVWKQGGGTAAANGAVMRCAGAALACFWDLEVLDYNAKSGAAVTHADPRCKASCVAVCRLLASALSGEPSATTELRRSQARAALAAAARPLSAEAAQELRNMAEVAGDGLPGLQLDKGGIGYTFKPVATGCWAFIHAESFQEAVAAVTMEAGDADSNAVVAGALLGARFGKAGLPQSWLAQVPELQREWLEQRVQRCLQSLGLDEESINEPVPPTLPLPAQPTTASVITPVTESSAPAPSASARPFVAVAASPHSQQSSSSRQPTLASMPAPSSSSSLPSVPRAPSAPAPRSRPALAQPPLGRALEPVASGAKGFGGHRSAMAPSAESELVESLAQRFLVAQQGPGGGRTGRDAYRDMLQSVAWSALEPSSAQEAATALAKESLVPVSSVEALRVFRRCLHGLLTDERVLDIVEYQMSSHFRRAARQQLRMTRGRGDA